MNTFIIKALYQELAASVSYVGYLLSEYKVEIALTLLLTLQLVVWF